MSKGEFRNNFKIQVSQDFKLYSNKENKEAEGRVGPFKKSINTLQSTKIPWNQYFQEFHSNAKKQNVLIVTNTLKYWK